MFNVSGWAEPNFHCIPEDITSCNSTVIGTIAAAVVGVFAYLWSTPAESFDLYSQEGVESSAENEPNATYIRYFTVTRENLTSDPLGLLRSFSDTLRDEESFLIRFEGEEGIDGGALTKEFFTLLLQSLKRGSSLGIFQYSAEELRAVGFTRESFYQTIFVDIFKYIGAKPTLKVEELFDGALVNRVFEVDTQIWNRVFAEQEKAGSKDSSGLLFLYELRNSMEQGSDMISFFNRCIACLKTKGAIDSEILELIEEVDGDLDPTFEASPENIREKLLGYLENAYQEDVQNLFYFVRALTCDGSGLFKEARYGMYSRRAGEGNLFPAVQGGFDKQRVANAFVISDRVAEEDLSSLEAKVNRLKRAIENIASEEEVKLFTRFVTGSTLLAQEQKIKVGTCESFLNYIHATSCFDLLDLYVPTTAGVDDTDEGLWGQIMSRMQNFQFLAE